MEGTPSSGSLTFLGGAGTVTGSRYLVSTDRAQVLVDCGTFRGLRELRRNNWEPFPVDPASVDAVVLTDAHLDHCGYLPRLAADGFAGSVYATRETIRLAEIALRESALLQEEEADHANEYGWSRHHPALPLYDHKDVERCLESFREVDFDTETPVADGFSCRLRNTGHILGSAWARLTLDGPAGSHTVAFSGDLGRQRHELLRSPAPFDGADTLLIESTYGDRRHDDLGSTAKFESAVTRTLRRGGTVLIPAPAVDHTEDVLHELAALAKTGALRDIPIHVDSPMALASLDVYRDALSARRPQILPTVTERGLAELYPPHLHPARSAHESRRVEAGRGPQIIIASSGMAADGRILNHLAEALPDPRDTVLIVGHAAVGTRARDLVDGAKAVKIHGRYVPVHAQIVEVPGLSAHADHPEILDWLRAAPEPPTTTYVVHGEPASAEALRRRLDERLHWPTVVPRPGERVLIP